MAVSDTPVIYSAPFRLRLNSPLTQGAFWQNGQGMSSVVTPALLFEDLALQRPSGEVPNLPFSKHPTFDK